MKYHLLSSMLLNELGKLAERLEVQDERLVTQDREHARELEELVGRLAALEARVPDVRPASLQSDVR